MATGLKAIGETLGQALGDMSSLSVETYTGKLEHVVTGDAGEETINFDGMLQNATSESSVTLMLATKINIDGDSKHYISDGEIPEYILTTHADAVKNGSAYRSQIISFLTSKVVGAMG